MVNKTSLTAKRPPLESSAPPKADLASPDRLSRQEFERRYQAMSISQKAELIEGVVYMASPLRFQSHAEPHSNLIILLGNYRLATPGLFHFSGHYHPEGCSYTNKARLRGLSFLLIINIKYKSLRSRARSRARSEAKPSGAERRQASCVEPAASACGNLKQ